MIGDINKSKNTYKQHKREFFGNKCPRKHLAIEKITKREAFNLLKILTPINKLLNFFLIYSSQTFVQQFLVLHYGPSDWLQPRHHRAQSLFGYSKKRHMRMTINILIRFTLSQLTRFDEIFHQSIFQTMVGDNAQTSTYVQ
jgi:hypothetical protein